MSYFNYRSRISACSSALLPGQIAGVVEVIEQGSNRYIQIVYQPANSRAYTRFFNGSSWSDWGRSDGYGCVDVAAFASLIGGQLGLSIYTIAYNATDAPFPEGYDGVVFQYKGVTSPSSTIVVCEIAFRGSSTTSISTRCL